MKIHGNLFKIFVFILPLLSFSPIYGETPPTTVSYQGFLTDSSGTAIASASYGIKVEIYEALTGGTAVYTETHSSVSVTNGRFAIELGTGTTSDTWSTAVDFGKALWLQLTMDTAGSNETLSPRIALKPSPYSRMALDVADAVVTENKLASSLVFDDGDLLNLSSIDASGSSEGLILPQASDVSSATAEGQITWDTDGDVLVIGTGSGQETFVNTSGTQTLSNKTLSSPTVSGGTINNASIGATTASTGAFTTLSSSSTFSTTGAATFNSTLTVSGASTLNGGLSVTNGSNSAGTIAIYEDSDDGSNKVTLQAQTLSSDYTLTLPTDDGSNGQILSTDGSGNLSWTSATTGDVTLTGTQTLTNKTLTSPTISGGTINNASVGATTPSTGAFTSLSASSTLSATGATTLSNTLTVSGASTLNSGLSVTNGSNSAGTIALYEDSDDGSNKVTLQAQALSSDYTLTLPTDDGTNGQVLSTDGSGTLSWTSQNSGDVTTTGTQTLTNKTLTSPTISGGTINNASVGATTPSSGAFTSLSASSTLSATGVATLSSTLTVSGASTLNSSLSVTNGSNSAGSIAIYEDSDDGSNKVTLQAQALSSDYTLTLPTDDGTSGQVLSTDGNGALSWSSQSSGDVTTTGTQTLTNKTLTSPTISGGTIDNASIGATTPGTGAFTTLSATGTSTLTTVDVNGGAIDSTTIGSTTPGSGAFTTLSAAGTSTLTTVDINGGVIDSTTIGSTTPSSGAFTTLSATGTSTLTTVDINGGAIDSAAIGGTTPSSGAFTTLSATGTSTLTTVDINGGAIDSATIGSTTPSSGAFTNLSVASTAAFSNTLSVAETSTLSIAVLANGSTSSGKLIIYEDSDSGSNNVTLQSQAMSSDYTLTLPADDGTSGQVLSTDGSGSLSWTSVSSSPFSTSSNVTSGGDSDDDFVFGSSQLADTGTSTSDDRMFFDKSKGAFRAGEVTTTQWDDSNVGNNSMATGLNTTASGTGSTALGANTTASGSYATSMGASTTASGDYSLAGGSNSTASANYSVAMGDSNTSSGLYATSFGKGNASEGNYTFTVGLSNTANGDISSAFGYLNASTANYSMVTGRNATAYAYASLVAGQYNTDRSSENRTTWSTSDSLFVLGNGTGSSAKSDALVVLKSGATTINGALTVNDTTAINGTLAVSSAATLNAGVSVKNGSSVGTMDLYEASGSGTNKVTIQPQAMSADYTLTLPADDGTSGQVLSTDGSGNLSWTSSSSSPFSTTSNVTSGGDSNDDFVFGSSTLADNGTDGDNRFFFDKSKGSFRAGEVTSTQWDDDNVGSNSFATGLNTTASGSYSNAMGNSTKATGNYSLSYGSSTLASGTATLVGGFSAAASSTGAVAIGSSSKAHGTYSVALGDNTNSYGSYSLAMGFKPTAYSYASVALGRFNTDRSSETTGSWQSTDALFVLGNGTGTSALADAFVVLKNGNATLAGSLTENSDIRLKHNIQPLSGVLGKLLKLQGVYYEFKNTETHPAGIHVGVIAQEVQKAFPELVSEDNQGFLSVAYDRLAPILLEGLKEQQSIIEQQQAELQQHKDELEKIKAALAKAGIVID